MVAPIPAKRGRKPAVATAPATGQVQSLTRGLKLLEWIAESNGSVALTELAQQAGLPNSTTHRLLTTMQQQGFVRQVGELGHWAIGALAVILLVSMSFHLNEFVTGLIGVFFIGAALWTSLLYRKNHLHKHKQS